MKPQFFGAIACVGLIFTGCSSAPETSHLEAPARLESDIAMEASTEEVQEVAAVTGEEIPRVAPQLIKTAEIDLQVESIDAIVTEIAEMVKQNRGDVLELRNNKPNNVGDRHSAFLRLRVPQQRLDRVLANIGELGISKRQTLSAEDVSTQLVDLDARLRNLRKQEDSLLAIMDRSGSIGDVLKVSQELGRVRSEIEQIDAQQKNLRDRVAFSTILVNLDTATAAVPRSRPLIGQLGETWENAVYGVGSLTTGMLKISLWLLAFSPYWLAIGVGIWLFRKYGKKMAAKTGDRHHNS
ncbi:MAG: DUF4349 domain-containing protein [Cyanobacteria bacterium P01_E01_bin.42]